MNTSIVRLRYAEALTKYVHETGRGEAVCAQAEKLARVIGEVPDLSRMVAAKDVVSDAEKMKLLRAALDEPMEADLERFIRLMMANGRTDLLPLTLRDFVDRYRRSIGIRKASLKVAVPPPESLLERLKALVRERTGCEAQIDVEVDPSLIGGFVFDIDDAMIDKSVSRQLELIRLQFIEKNRRIV